MRHHDGIADRCQVATGVLTTPTAALSVPGRARLRPSRGLPRSGRRAGLARRLTIPGATPARGSGQPDQAVVEKAGGFRVAGVMAEGLPIDEELVLVRPGVERD